MEKMTNTLLVIAVVFIAAGLAHSDSVEILHEFAGGSNDGADPWGSLILNSGKLYGMTFAGGSSLDGTVFSIGTDGSNYTLLRELAGGINDGANPSGDLILDSGKLYGTTSTGGTSNYGTVFSMNTDGRTFTLLHEFAGGIDGGQSPRGSLILDSGTLYGMTYDAGSGGRGTVFSLNTDGTGFDLLHEFAGGSNDGADPSSSLILDSGALYGMTYRGGISDRGTIFSINTDGSSFSLIHKFAGEPNGGRKPYYGSLNLIDAKLYGLTLYGGAFDKGVAFSMNTNGSDMTILHDFATEDGINPYGSLTLHAGKLHGLTTYGGDYNKGTAFSMDIDGNNFSLLHEFAGGPDDGQGPHGSLTHNLGAIYGMTTAGGNSNSGTIFAIYLPGDVNADGFVDDVDLNTIIDNWGLTGATHLQGDLSGDGTVSGPDYTEVITYWGTGLLLEPPSGSPEPATLGLLLVGGLAMLKRRHWKLSKSR